YSLRVNSGIASLCRFNQCLFQNLTPTVRALCWLFQNVICHARIATGNTIKDVIEGNSAPSGLQRKGTWGGPHLPVRLHFPWDLLGLLIEEVVRCVRYKRLLANVRRRCTTRRWCDPSMSVQALDECRICQPVAASGSGLTSDHRKQKPGNCTGSDEMRVGGAILRWILHFCPDGATVSRVLPRGPNRAITHGCWISVHLLGVRTEEVRC